MIKSRLCNETGEGGIAMDANGETTLTVRCSDRVFSREEVCEV